MTTRADALAALALATPALDAPAALEILVDAMLEDAMLEPAGAEAQLRKALVWARRRFEPSTLERLVALVGTALATEPDLPAFVVGVVRPWLVRLHFFAPVPPYERERLRALAAAVGPVGLYFEVTTPAS